MAAVLAAAVVSLLIAACGDGDSSSAAHDSRLPPDPYDWVCRDSLSGASQAEIDAWCAAHPDRGRPLPEELRAPPPLASLEEKNRFDERLEAFAKSEAYRVELGWIGDAGWRFTGPYVGEIGSGYSYGTHLPVRIYYSPEVIDWLCTGRQGALPDGAMIIKEMHVITPALDVVTDDDGCMDITADLSPLAWAMMIRDDTHAHDGWYWSIMQRDTFPLYPEERVDPPLVDRSAFGAVTFVPPVPLAPDPLWYPTGYWHTNPDKIPNVIDPQSAYGAICLSCHVSAASESTFAALDNVLGRSIRYRQFPAPADEPPSADGGNGVHALLLARDAGGGDGTYDTPFQIPLADPDPAFLAFYDQLDPVSFARAWSVRFPAETWDHVVAAPGGADGFLTSDQCAPCHDAITYLADVSNMTVEAERNGTTQTINLSPYGEWQASPMGLAGRDPIFYAQLEGETNALPDHAACIENTCLHCHGVMGQRQLASDTAATGDDRCREFFGVAPPAEVPFGEPFRAAAVAQWPGSADTRHQTYGALARDGVSCTVCHRIGETALGDEASFTGNFVTGPPSELYGPYAEDVVTVAMENAFGITPQHGAQTANSDLCGSCHNILLPVFANDGTRLGFAYEQTTHLEWLNSAYAPGREHARTCQDCHMPRTFADERLAFQVANFESSDYPPTTYRVPDEEIALPTREHYARHSLHGLNLFLNQMFQQFPLLLGYRQAERFTRTKLDYPPLLLGQDSMVDLAQEQTATVAIRSLARSADGLQAVVRVTNRAGHFLPSGVGFRRVILELTVRDADGALLWASGRTNALGALVAGRTDEVLPSEQPLRFPTAYQPHHQTISDEAQVQIYEEVVADSAGARTSSFLHRVTTQKDNRIRPAGYNPQFYDRYESPYLRALGETPGAAADDPFYTDPRRTGADEITYAIRLDAETRARAAQVDVALHYQAIPPAYLQQRFAAAQHGPGARDAIDRLYYLTSHLDLRDITDGEGRRVLENWKLTLATTSRAVPR